MLSMPFPVLLFNLSILVWIIYLTEIIQTQYVRMTKNVFSVSRSLRSDQDSRVLQGRNRGKSGIKNIYNFMILIFPAKESTSFPGSYLLLPRVGRERTLEMRLRKSLDTNLRHSQKSLRALFQNAHVKSLGGRLSTVNLVTVRVLSLIFTRALAILLQRKAILWIVDSLVLIAGATCS